MALPESGDDGSQEDRLSGSGRSGEEDVFSCEDLVQYSLLICVESWARRFAHWDLWLLLQLHCCSDVGDCCMSSF